MIQDLNGSLFWMLICRLESINEGFVNDDGDAIFNVSFKALVYRPLKGEVIDGIISGIERVGLEVMVGAVKVFIPHTKIPSEMKFSEEQNAFVSEEDPTQVISEDSLIRFKVENVSIKGQEGAAILVENFLYLECHWNHC